MSMTLIYKCDACGKTMTPPVGESVTRGGSIFGADVEWLNEGGSSWHVCSDSCLLKMLETWCQKVRAGKPRKPLPPPTEDSPYPPRKSYGG
jgi:hypothetical protein